MYTQEAEASDMIVQAQGRCRDHRSGQIPIGARVRRRMFSLAPSSIAVTWERCLPQRAFSEFFVAEVIRGQYGARHSSLQAKHHSKEASFRFGTAGACSRRAGSILRNAAQRDLGIGVQTPSRSDQSAGRCRDEPKRTGVVCRQLSFENADLGRLRDRARRVGGASMSA